MKFPIRRKEIHSCENQRLRVFIDLDARKLDASVIELLGLEVSVHDTQKEGWTYERLIGECLRTAAWLRTQVNNPYPPTVFIPYVEMTLTDSDREAARVGLLSAMAAGFSDDHVPDPSFAMNRVNSLGKAVDLLAFLQKRELQ